MFYNKHYSALKIKQMKVSSLVYWSISGPVAMLQLLFFFEELLYQGTSDEQLNVGLSAHASPQSDNDTDAAGSGHSPDLLHTSSLRVKPVVVNPRKLLCTFFLTLS